MTIRVSDLGQQLKSLRKLKGLRQDQLAELAGIDSKSLSRIERGVFLPSLDTVQKLADALGISVAEMFGDDARDTRVLRRHLLEVAATTPDADLQVILDAVSKARSGL
jgi:transcriptional regulator with XRE-family HTH domain